MPTRFELIHALTYELNISNVYLTSINLGLSVMSTFGFWIDPDKLDGLTDTELFDLTDQSVQADIRSLSSAFSTTYGVPFMSAIANIVINDGQATPVAHTFYPVASSPNAIFREAIGGLALIGQGLLKLAVVADKGNGLNKVRLTIDLPALEVVTGNNSLGYSAAPKVGYSDKVNVDFILPSRATAQQRKDLRVLLINALANAQVIDAVENLNVPY